MGAALSAYHRMDLIDDDRIDRAERVASLARENEVERLRRRNEDVRRIAVERGSVTSGRVAGPDENFRLVDVGAHPLGVAGDAYQWGPKVFLDVYGQCFEGRDVEDTA